MVDITVLTQGILTVFGLYHIFVPGVICKDICAIYDRNYTYCEDGYYCCESNTKCCPVTVSFGAIVGLVIVGLFALTLCIVCAMFIVKKHHTRPNQIISPSNSNSRQGISVIARRSNNHRDFMVRPPPYESRPPDYTQGEFVPPPAYSEIIREQDGGGQYPDGRPPSRPPSYKP